MMKVPIIIKKNYKVLVRCSTFNHAPYIKDSLDGVAMQRTSFPFVCYVVDDASTDGEQDVIREWYKSHCDVSTSEIYDTELANVIVAHLNGNVDCTFAFYLLKKNLYGKQEKGVLLAPWMDHSEYYAICEGDDYWTDSLKLQKQVDFLESHSEFSMCFHTAIQHWEDGRQPDEIFRQIENREYSGMELFETWTAATASVLLRSNVVQSSIYKSAMNNKKFCFGDIVTWLCAAHEGKVWGMSDVMSVYRRQETGAVFKYDLNRIKRQAYHSLEMYKVFGKQYKKLSKQKFFHFGQEAFFGQKSNGIIDYNLLWDLFKYTPLQTLNKLGNMVVAKV